MNPHQFDTIIHLVGEQPLPIYIGMLQFSCPRHILAVTDRTRPVGAALKQVAAKRGLEADLLDVPAYDGRAAGDAFDALLNGRGPGSAALNLTGGTKPMFSGGYQAGLKACAPMYYVETTRRELHWLGEAPRKEPLRPTMDSVKTFVELAGCRLNTDVGEHWAGWTEQNGSLLAACWKHREALGRWQGELARRGYSQYLGVPFQSQWNGRGVLLAAELKGPPDYAGALKIGDFEKRESPWMDLAGFLTGGWFERHTYRHLLLLRRSGRLRDMILNAAVETATSGPESQKAIQEFDIAFTDGFCLTIVECKAGAVNQDHVQKLENLVQRFGGHFGRGILASVFKFQKPMERRILSLSRIAAITESALMGNPDAFLTADAGTLLSSPSQTHS
ncbi:MAG: DUF1887 family protein [Lentisphaerae bacterium]|nr:DUF1887 family protein [Lentisphaerota bacterium]